MSGPKVFYYCYDQQRPTGGNKGIYRHVDILNRHGIEAYVLHTAADFRLNWFPNQTRVINAAGWNEVIDTARDFTVFPEDLGSLIVKSRGKKVIFNQNAYYGFNAFGKATKPLYPYLNPDVAAVLCVSDHNAEYMRFAFPNIPVHRIAYHVDPQRFACKPLTAKKKQIAMTVKSPYDMATLINVLKPRALQGLNAFKDYEWVFLENKTEEEVVAILRDSLFYVFLSVTEGFPLSPFEAVLAGCLVVAYRCGPLEEHISPEFLFEPYDILGMARWMEKAAQAFPERIEAWQPLVQAARQKALQYSAEREEQSVLAAWDKILAAGAASQPLAASAARLPEPSPVG